MCGRRSEHEGKQTYQQPSSHSYTLHQLRTCSLPLLVRKYKHLQAALLVFGNSSASRLLSVAYPESSIWHPRKKAYFDAGVGAVPEVSKERERLGH